MSIPHVQVEDLVLSEVDLDDQIAGLGRNGVTVRSGICVDSSSESVSQGSVLRQRSVEIRARMFELARRFLSPGSPHLV